MNEIKSKVIKSFKSPIIFVFTLIATLISIFFACLIAIGVGENFSASDKYDNSSLDTLENNIIDIIAPNNKKLKVEVANDNLKREKGLMYRDYLGDDEGMLFIFDEEKPLTFWMKNTYIPLDIIFLNSQKQVVQIYTNTKTNQTIETYPSIVPAQYVVEVNAFWTLENNIKVGDFFNW